MENTPERQTSPEFSEINRQIHELMDNAYTRFDSINVNLMSAERKTSEGHSVFIGMSIRPDSEVAYHVRKELSEDAEGNIETWDFHWGESRGSTVTYARTHKSRMHLSFPNPDDIFEPKDIDPSDVDEIKKLVEQYKISKSVEG